VSPINLLGYEAKYNLLLVVWDGFGKDLSSGVLPAFNPVFPPALVYRAATAAVLAQI
jgi:hypothetical protein